jgi:hypothetical protein
LDGDALVSPSGDGAGGAVQAERSDLVVGPDAVSRCEGGQGLDSVTGDEVCCRWRMATGS